MKTAFLADLHANREALEAVLDHARQQGAQRWVLLGDFVGYGADPGWVVDQVRDLVREGACAVMGGLVLLIALALAMAPRDDSTLGVMKALVFRCH